MLAPVDLSSEHSTQSALEAFPCSFEYVSTPQSKHAVCPLPSWYCPAGHAKQSSPAIKLNLPRSHAAQKLVPRVGASSPCRHCVQLAWSVSLCAKPMGQSVQISSLLTTCLNLPGVQSEHLVLPSLEVRPSAHDVHSVVLFLSVEKVFALQSLQVAALLTSLYSPLTQGIHDVCSGDGWAYPSGHCLHSFKLDESV